MATTTFNTRISLKYDTYAQWVEKDPNCLSVKSPLLSFRLRLVP